MFARSLTLPADKSFFLFGPRGTGKSTLLRTIFPDAVYFDLLDLGLYSELLANPGRIEALAMPRMPARIVIDEIQRIPELLDEVHRLIEGRRWRFALTGSSARKLRRGGVNLLAGRARTLALHPLTAAELGDKFNLLHSVRYGQLPSVYVESDPKQYLSGYVGTYLREEVQAEALTRNLDAFSRFLVAASFSQGSVLSVSNVARELGIPRKTIEGYFDLLDDLLIAIRLPVFVRRARRDMIAHPKFYFFDAGVYRTLRPAGPLDSPEDIDGPAVETLVLQELRAVNDNHDLGYTLSYWRTRDQKEVDFVLYGERGLVAIEVKRSANFQERDLADLKLFAGDYPASRCILLYGGKREYVVEGIRVIPLASALPALLKILR
jgi:predicted AAA+ superfamily ATPase